MQWLLIALIYHNVNHNGLDLCVSCSYDVLVARVVHADPAYGKDVAEALGNLAQ